MRWYLTHWHDRLEERNVMFRELKICNKLNALLEASKNSELPTKWIFPKVQVKAVKWKGTNQDEVDKAASCNTFFPFIDLHLLKSNKKALETRFTESFMEALDRHTSWESLSHAVPKNTFRIPKIQVIIFPTVWVRYRWIILKNCCQIKIQWP